MPKIAFIASDKQLFLQGKSIVQELELGEQVQMYFARLSRAVRLAAQLQAEGVEVIIARGAAAQLIPENSIRIPMVNIIVSGQDLAHIFQAAKAACGLPNPKVAFIAFSNVAPDMEALSEVLGIDLTVYRVKSEAEIPLMVKAAASQPCDVIVGGKRTVSLAKTRGLKAIPIQSGDSSIRSALLEAQKIALGRQIEKENAEKFKVLIDHSLEGIISITREKTIQVFNTTAERLLKRKAAETVGKPLDAVIDLPNTDTCLTDGQPALGHIVHRGAIWINVNIVPILVDGVSIGAFITLQDISHIQEAEAKIRREVSARKFIATYDFPDILGHSPQINEAKRIAGEFAKVDVTTLIIGESGTGKELFAQSIHNRSSRKNGPFVAINCAALPANLLESELFGYVEGAFTGATKKGKTGLFELAHRGTIFLDEISEMDKHGQSRLLRVLQEKQVMRLGDDKYIPVDVRIIAATNKNLTPLIAAGEFRQDLFYRLKVLVLNLPPLRNRSGDVEYLAHHFLAHYNALYGKSLAITPDAYQYLATCPWPGNAREFTHFMERLVISASETTISADIIQRYCQERECETTLSPAAPAAADAPEDARLLAILADANYNISAAASALGMARSTLYRKLRHYNISIRKSY